MIIDVGQFAGVLYNLDLKEGSVNCIRSTIQQFPFLPIPDYNYGYFYAGKNHFTDRQTKNYNLYQIFITHSGKGRLLVEGNEYALKKNSIVLLDLDARHRYETDGDHWEYEWVNFSGAPCAYYHQKINQGGVRVYDIASNSRLKSLMHDIGVLAAETGEMKYVMTGNAIMRLLDEFMALSMEYAQQKMLPHKKDNIERIKRYLDEHYMDEISLDALSEMAYLSKYHFTRTFTSYAGVSPYQYLIALRLNHARHLLLLTNTSIEEISFQTGFKNSKNFIRAFKQATGTTPEKYRLENR